MDPGVGSDEAEDINIARALSGKAKPLSAKLTTPRKSGRNAGSSAALDNEEDATETSGAAAGLENMADGEDDEGEVDRDKFMFPKGPLGNKMLNFDAKVGSLVGDLSSENWRACLAPVRSNVRGVVGFSIELQTCEHPRLIEVNKKHMQSLSSMLQLMKGVKALSIEYSVPNLIALCPLLGNLLDDVKDRCGRGQELDAALMVLKVKWGGGVDLEVSRIA